MLKSELQDLVEACEQMPEIKWRLQLADRVRVLEDGTLHNSLSNLCGAFSMRVAEQIQERAPTSNPIIRSSRLHTCLEFNTDDAGLLFVDPTFGQLVVSNRIFLGDESQLREAFLNPNNRFLLGSRFNFAHTITLAHRTIKTGDPVTREDWYDIIYQPLVRDFLFE